MMFRTIQKMDEYCKIHNKAIIVHTGKIIGLVPGYYVGKKWNVV